jgi:hypothetical protein
LIFVSVQFKEYLFPSQMSRLTIFQVQAYQSRAVRLPPEIVSTALLTQALIIPSSSPGLIFRTSMTLALIRFVNSLLDPIQKRDKSLPLRVLANGAGLPIVFVEVRHWGTHENNLPSTEVLREMGIRALEWLWTNYWAREDVRVGIISRWERKDVSEIEFVSAFQVEEERCYEELVEKLSSTDDFEESRGRWDSLIQILFDKVASFPETFIEYLTDLLISQPACMTTRYHTNDRSNAISITTYN